MRSTQTSSSESLSFRTKSMPTLWTARLIATLWKLAVKRVYKLRRRNHDTTDFMYGSVFEKVVSRSKDGKKQHLDLSIIQEAALLIVTSGVISLADLETVIGYRLSEDLNNDEEALTMDSDVTWETPTCMSDCNRIMDNSSSESTQEASQQVTNLTTTDDTVVLQQQSTPRQTLHKPSKWICVGYGRVNFFTRFVTSVVRMIPEVSKGLAPCGSSYR